MLTLGASDLLTITWSAVSSSNIAPFSSPLLAPTAKAVDKPKISPAPLGAVIAVLTPARYDNLQNNDKSAVS